MSAAKKLNLVSVEDYLAAELDGPVRHEYVGGVLYAMAGARNAHNLIKVNVIAATHVRLRGGRCRPFDSDTKIRIHLPGHVRFYYPDLSVICQPNPQMDAFQDKPVVLFEVLSRRTRRIDEGEKKDAYLKIPSLKVYVLVEQEFPALVVFRRTGRRFVREVYEGLETELPLPEIQTVLPLAEIYEGVEFVEESEEDEG